MDATTRRGKELNSVKRTSMVRRTCFTVVAALSALGLGSVPALARDRVPAGYGLIDVEEAGLSVAIPDDFVVSEMTRRDARAVVAANPELFDRVDEAIQQLLRTPLLAGKDEDGDSYYDVSLSVNIADSDGVAMPTARQAELALAAMGARRITAHRTRLDGVPAIWSECTFELTRSDGVTVTSRALAVSFARGQRLVTLTGNEAPNSGHRDALVKMLRSVRVR